MRPNGQIAAGCTASTYGSLAALSNGVTQATLVSKAAGWACANFKIEFDHNSCRFIATLVAYEAQLNAALMPVNGSLCVFPANPPITTHQTVVRLSPSVSKPLSRTFTTIRYQSGQC